MLVERTFPAAVVFGESEFEFDSAGRVLFRVYADPGFETTPNAMLSKPCGTNAGLLVLTPTGEIAMVTYLRSGILSFASLRDLDYSLRPKLGCVVAPVGPESIGILPGFALGDTISLQGNFGTLLNRVTIGGQPASIISQGPGTATVAIPYEVSPGPEVDLVAETAGRPMPAFPIAIRALNPRWVPPAYNVNGTENSPTNPANWGTTIELRFRGLGPYQPSLPAGDLTPAGTTARLQAPVSFSVPGPNGGAPWFPATIEYAGPVPGLLPGLTAVRIRTPPFQFFSGSLFQPAYTGTFTILGNNIPVFLGLR